MKTDVDFCLETETDIQTGFFLHLNIVHLICGVESGAEEKIS